MKDISSLLRSTRAMVALWLLRWAQREMGGAHPDAAYVTLRIRHWEQQL